jgi:hypothetical protein
LVLTTRNSGNDVVGAAAAGSLWSQLSLKLLIWSNIENLLSCFKLMINILTHTIQ